MARRLNTLVDVRRMLSRVANDLDMDLIKESKARTLTYVLSILSQVIRDSELESRVEALEKLLQEQEQ